MSDAKVFSRLRLLSSTFPAVTKSWAFRIASAVILVFYVALGVHTQWSYPFPYDLMYDFGVYLDAFHRAIGGLDPYAYQDIWRAYLYPLPGLLVLSPLLVIADGGLRTAAYLGTNLALCALMLWGIAHVYGYRLREIWWWFPLAFGFAPLLELLAAGQVNLIASFGIFLMFAASDALPALAGIGFTVGFVTKLTPVVFVAYLAIRRRFRALAWSLILTLAAFALSYAIFGWRSAGSYLNLVSALAHRFTPDTNSQALVSVLYALGWMEPAAWVDVQRLLLAWVGLMCAVSGLCALSPDRREPFFLVLSLGMTVASNVMWYHYYVFLLLPVFVWIAWSRFNLRVVVWCIFGLTLIQVDRWGWTRGLLPHLFVHASIGAIVAWQLADRLRSGSRVRLAAAAAAVPVVLLLVWLTYRVQESNTNLVEARTWIEKNVPSGAWIAEASSGPSVDQTKYHVAKFDDLLVHPPEWYRNQGWDYIVTDYGTHQDSGLFVGLQRAPDANDQVWAPSFSQVAKLTASGYGVGVFSTGQPQPMERVSARFGIAGEWLDLIGYDFSPSTVIRGEPLTIDLYWRPFEQRRNQLQLTARLLDRSDAEVARSTGGFYVATDPGERWPPGVTRVPWNIPVPAVLAPGLYRVELDLDSVGVGRIPVLDSGSRPISDKLIIGPFRIPSAPPPEAEIKAAESANARFGNALALIAYSLSAKSPRAGESVQVQLYWRSDARSQQNYTVFLHLLDSAGNIRSQVDEQPLDGQYPTSAWDVGETVRDTHAMPVPRELPPGDYRIELGMYEYPSLARLSVADINGKDLGDRLLLDDVIRPAVNRP